jgi:hypothetical protein
MARTKRLGLGKSDSETVEVFKERVKIPVASKTKLSIRKFSKSNKREKLNK